MSSQACSQEALLIACSLHIVTAIFLALVPKPCFGSDITSLMMMCMQVCVRDG